LLVKSAAPEQVFYLWGRLLEKISGPVFFSDLSI